MYMLATAAADATVAVAIPHATPSAHFIVFYVLFIAIQAQTHWHELKFGI